MKTINNIVGIIILVVFLILISATVSAGTCGNGVCENDERWTCNTYCSADCCGNGVCEIVEANACGAYCAIDCCGDGECRFDENHGNCPEDCYCGSGVCDSDENPDSCGEDCSRYCGNGYVDPGELCDDGSQNSDTGPDACRTNCVPAGCGDGVADSDEDCDGDDLNYYICTDFPPFHGGYLSCNNDCTFDKSECTYCGDGIIQSDKEEECDDGNNIDDDGCNADCTECVLLDVTGNIDVEEDTEICTKEYDFVDDGDYGAIIIKSSGVTLDCDGASIFGDGGGIGIYNFRYHDVTIKKCNIYKYETGIKIEEADRITLIKNNLCNTLDIELIDSQDNSGTSNACYHPGKWNDDGQTGCTIDNKGHCITKWHPALQINETPQSQQVPSGMTKPIGSGDTDTTETGVQKPTVPGSIVEGVTVPQEGDGKTPHTPDITKQPAVESDCGKDALVVTRRINPKTVSPPAFVNVYLTVKPIKNDIKGIIITENIPAGLKPEWDYASVSFDADVEEKIKSSPAIDGIVKEINAKWSSRKPDSWDPNIGTAMWLIKDKNGIKEQTFMYKLSIADALLSNYDFDGTWEISGGLVCPIIEEDTLTVEVIDGWPPCPVSNQELLGYIDQWSEGQLTDTQILQVIYVWAKKPDCGIGGDEPWE